MGRFVDFVAWFIIGVAATYYTQELIGSLRLGARGLLTIGDELHALHVVMGGLESPAEPAAPGEPIPMAPPASAN